MGKALERIPCLVLKEARGTAFKSSDRSGVGAIFSGERFTRPDVQKYQPTQISWECCGEDRLVKLVYLLIWGSTIIFGASAVWALVWAIQRGEMSDFKAGAESIFDDEEPVGHPTDAFPGAHA